MRPKQCQRERRSLCIDSRRQAQDRAHTVSTKSGYEEARGPGVDWVHDFPFLIQTDCDISGVNSLIVIYITLFPDRARLTDQLMETLGR